MYLCGAIHYNAVIFNIYFDFLGFCIDWCDFSLNTLLYRGPRELQGDVVYHSAPCIWAQMRGEGWVAGSQPMRKAVHITWHGTQKNIGDLTPYLTYERTSPIPSFLWLSEKPPPPPVCSVYNRTYVRQSGAIINILHKTKIFLIVEIINLTVTQKFKNSPIVT